MIREEANLPIFVLIYIYHIIFVSIGIEIVTVLCWLLIND